MKEYTVGYWIGSYYYESVIRTNSFYAAMLWVNTIGGVNATLLKEVEVTE